MLFNVELLPGGKLPKKANPSDAGYDLYANEAVTIYVGETKLVRCGFKLGLKEGWEAQIRGRSGLGLKGLTVGQGIGTVDAGYRGEVGAILRNHGATPCFIKPGDRIAQMVLYKLDQAELTEGPVDATDRGEKGYGSSGV
jgi:dUTP pyrophosphatase